MLAKPYLHRRAAVSAGLTRQLRIALSALISSACLLGCPAPPETGDDAGTGGGAVGAGSGTTDNLVPSTPTNLIATTVSPSQVAIRWSPSSDNVAVTGYRVFRNGALLASTGNVSTYQDTSVTASTSYSYTVQSRDGAGNSSGQSTALIITTPAALDAIAPSTPTGLVANAVSASRIDLSWTAATDNVGVAGYRVLLDGALLATVGNVTAYQSAGLAPSTTYGYAVQAVDAAGNISGLSVAASATTTSSAGDTIAPSTPTNLGAIAVSPSQINLAWPASTDNVAVSGYRVYRDGVLVAVLPVRTAHQDIGLSPTTTYAYNVEAIDAAGNVSGLSPGATATTRTTPDVTPPSTPTGVTANAVSPFRIALSWSAATDDVAVIGYRIFRNGLLLVTLGNVTTYQNTGLSPSTTYSYAVRAIDTAGNVSGLSATTSATTQAAPDIVAPSTPSGLTAVAASSSQINLSWLASTDNVAVTGYRVYRNGAFLASLGNVTTYQNFALAASTTYSYNVDAIDAAGNASGISAAASAMTQASGPSGAGRILNDGFEDGTTNAWQQDDFRDRCQVVTSAFDGVTGPRSGSRMLRCNWNGTLDWNDPARFETLTIPTDSYSDELFIRAWLRLDQNMSAAAKLMRIYFNAGGVYHDLFASTWPGGGPGYRNEGADSFGSYSTYWGDGFGDFTKDNRAEWHRVEYYIRQSTGSIKVWHDGILVRSVSGLNFEGVKWSPFYLTSNAEPSDATSHVYFDDIEVFSDRGSGATGSMRDASIQR